MDSTNREIIAYDDLEDTKCSFGEDLQSFPDKRMKYESKVNSIIQNWKLNSKREPKTPNKSEQSELDDDEENELNDGTSDCSEFNDGFDSDLMGDEEDRRTLANMSEKEREMVLFKRSERREELKRRWEIEKKIKYSKRSSIKPKVEAKVRSLERTTNVKYDDKRNCAMALLKAKREDKQKKDHQKTKKDPISEQGKKECRQVQKQKKDVSSSPDKKESYKNKEEPTKDVKPAKIRSLRQLSLIQITRDQLEKLLYVPFFSKAIKGTFVRVSMLKSHHCRYEIAEVIEVISCTKIYELGYERTNKALLIGRNGKQEIIRMEYVSNSKFLPQEFDDWLKNCKDPPTVERIDQKKSDIKAAFNYKFTAKDIDGIAMENKRLGILRSGFAERKCELLTNRDAAIEAGEADLAFKIEEEIAHLDDRSKEIDMRRTSSIQTIAYINERNRRSNIERAEQAIKEETANKSKNNSTTDPFTRRSTKPTMKITSSLEANLERLAREELQSASENPMRSMTENPNGFFDLYALHNFDVDIDINLCGPPLKPLKLAPIIPVEPLRSNGPKFQSWRIKWDEYKRKNGIL